MGIASCKSNKERMEEAYKLNTDSVLRYRNILKGTIQYGQKGPGWDREIDSIHTILDPLEKRNDQLWTELQKTKH